MKTIGMIAAMPEETEHILSLLGKEISSGIISGYQVKEFKVYGKKIILINSGIGEISAAAATMLLIDRYKVRTIINFGLSGALKSGIKLNDMLIVKDIVHYDFDISAFCDNLKGAYPGYDTAFFETDKELRELADRAAGTVLNKVRIASGDKFIASSETKERLISDFDADICDMEAAGIAITAARAEIPVLFIKTISDLADECATSSISDKISRGVTDYKVLIDNLLRLI
ncbi:MAG: 5'-methylthioadenosine/S-adenosylhomocysteine nucleosidase [Christensenellales bacterium]|jgi:adenosylhomocysteine nucleosidase